MRQKQSRDGNKVESRDESRAPAKTKRVSKERRKASNDSQMLELVRRALLYRKSATAAVVLHVESDLHEHANGPTGAVRGAHLAFLAPLTRAANGICEKCVWSQWIAKRMYTTAIESATGLKWGGAKASKLLKIYCKI